MSLRRCQCVWVCAHERECMCVGVLAWRSVTAHDSVLCRLRAPPRRDAVRACIWWPRGTAPRAPHGRGPAALRCTGAAVRLSSAAADSRLDERILVGLLRAGVVGAAQPEQLDEALEAQSAESPARERRRLRQLLQLDGKIRTAGGVRNRAAAAAAAQPQRGRPASAAAGRDGPCGGPRDGRGAGEQPDDERCGCRARATPHAAEGY